MVDRPHWGWWLAIGGGLALNALVAFSPAAYDAWCRLVTPALSRAVVQAIFMAAALTHLGEALHARRLAHAAGLPNPTGWFWQTLALGCPSLGLLRRRVAIRSRSDR
jgi:hypothetical protein